MSTARRSGAAARSIAWIAGALLVIAIAGVLTMDSAPIGVRKFSGADVSRLLGSLGVIALFVERTLEVFVAAARSEAAEKLSASLTSARFAIATRSADLQTHATAGTLSGQLIEHRAGTRRLTNRVAVLVGILLGAAGLSTLATFYDLPAEGPRAALFRILDILITAGLIGGGTQALHKVLTAVLSYVDATTAASERRREGLPLPLDPVPPSPLIPPLTPGPPERVPGAERLKS